MKGSKCGCHPLHAGDLTGLDSLCGEVEPTGPGIWPVKAPSGVQGVEGAKPPEADEFLRFDQQFSCILHDFYH